MSFFNAIKNNAQKMKQIVETKKEKKSVENNDIKITKNTIQFSIDDEEEDETPQPTK